MGFPTPRGSNDDRTPPSRVRDFPETTIMGLTLSTLTEQGREMTVVNPPHPSQLERVRDDPEETVMEIHIPFYRSNDDPSLS